MQREGRAKEEGQILNANALEALTPEQVLEIDRALTSIGPFGEVRLIKIKGRLRFLQQLESHDLLRLCHMQGED